MKKKFRFCRSAAVLGVALVIVGCATQQIAMQGDLERLAVGEKKALEPLSYPIPMPVEPPLLAMPEARRPSAILSDLDEREKPTKDQMAVGESKPTPLPDEPKP